MSDFTPTALGSPSFRHTPKKADFWRNFSNLQRHVTVADCKCIDTFCDKLTTVLVNSGQVSLKIGRQSKLVSGSICRTPNKLTFPLAGGCSVRIRLLANPLLPCDYLAASPPFHPNCFVSSSTAVVSAVISTPDISQIKLFCPVGSLGWRPSCQRVYADCRGRVTCAR